MNGCKRGYRESNKYCNLFRCPCLEDGCRNFGEFTNGDRIRAMSDEELAEYLVYHNPYHTESNCLKWLKQPAR